MLHMPSVRDRNRRTSLGQVSGGVAIHDAVVKGKIHLAKFILDAVESQTVVNTRDAHGKTPLIRAVRIEEEGVRSRVVDLLVKYNADVNLVDHVGRTALSYACELHRNDVIRKLVKNNVDPDLPDKNGNSPLMYCAETGNAAGIEILSKSFRRLGLDVDTVNADGMTPLMVAAKCGYGECAQLLAHGAKASLSRRDNVHNKNAVDWAREGGCSTPDVQALQTRSRTHSRSAVNLSAGEPNESPAQRNRHRREPTALNASAADRGSTASLPYIDSDDARESLSKLTGSQPDIRNLHNDKHRFRQLSPGQTPNRSRCPNAGSSRQQSTGHCEGRPRSPETPTKPAQRWGSEPESGSGNPQRKLSLDDILDDLKSGEKIAVYQDDPQPRSDTSGSVVTQRVQPPPDHRKRPLSANVANRHSNRQTKSFDSALTPTNSRPSGSIDNLTLTVSQALVPHPPATAREASNLSRFSHLSRSTEVLSHRSPSLEHPAGPGNGSISYVDLQGITGGGKREAQSSLSPGDLSGLFARPHSALSNQEFEHLPALSPQCIPREV